MVTSVNNSTQTTLTFLNQIVEKAIKTQAQALVQLTDSLHYINKFAVFPLSGLKQDSSEMVDLIV